MIKTTHLLERISQRGIKSRMLMLVIEFGKHKRDKYILDKKNVGKLIEELNILKQELMKISDKGGVIVVSDNGVVITAYNRLG